MSKMNETNRNVNDTTPSVSSPSGFSKRDIWIARVETAHVPTYFKALLFEASAQYTVEGLEGSFRYDYSIPGSELARHHENYVDPDVLDDLYENLFNEKKVRAWLWKHLRRFIELVPPKRRSIFLKGFLRRMEDDGYYIHAWRAKSRVS